MYSNRVLHMALLVMSISAAATPTLAAMKLWNGGLVPGPYVWSNPNVWNPNGVPGSNDNVLITSGSATYFTCFIDQNAFADRIQLANNNDVSLIGAGTTLTVGNITVTPGTSSHTHLISANVALSKAADWTVGGTHRLILTGALSSSYNLNKIGNGSLYLAGNNNAYTGNIILTRGELEVTAGNGISSSTTVDVKSNGSLFILNDEYVGGLTGVGNVILNEFIGVGQNNADAVYGGVISGTGAVLKVGTGVQTLTGANTYSGGTDVRSGTLLINNGNGSATGTGPIDVQANATLGGTGNASGLVTVNSSGKIAPGNGIGVLTLADMDLDPGSTLAVELGGLAPGSEHDQLVVTNITIIRGSLDISYTDGFTAQPGDSFVILTAGVLDGTFESVSFPDGQNWSVDYDSAANTVTVGICPDGDGDDVCDEDDACPGFDDSFDADSDGIPDACDICFGKDALGDSDGDGLCDAPIVIDWRTGAGGVRPGSMCSTEVSISPVFNGLPSTGNFSAAAYDFAPMGTAEEYAGYAAATDWTATFDPPVDDLLLYTYFWRGAGAGGPDPVTYAFDRPFTIVSGMDGAVVNGNTLELASNTFDSGILRFTGPISTLSVVTSATSTGAGQGLTFATVTPTADSDSDGYTNACDGCPNDPNKTEPGSCGCGIDETDSDSDGTADCNDGCPNDPNKTEPGMCGCGVDETDSDSDGTADCNDNCPSDPNKTEPGMCGCGVDDTDTDSDGTADCNDNCPNDPNNIEPGMCGCGVDDTDTDSDGIVDCNDGCPNDPDKTEPGLCGCGVADADSDSDGIVDCNDGCPNDPDKTEPGLCGCGVADTDGDNDMVPGCFDCNDADGEVFPGNSETICDGIDNDCDPLTEDNPGDTCNVQDVVLTGEGPRYLEIIPADGAVPVALRITSVDAPCLTKYIDLDADSTLAELGIARLVENPVYRLPADWGVLHARGNEIVPGYQYTIQPEVEGVGLLAEGVTFATYDHGDVNNNGFANYADIQLVVQGFQQTYQGPLGAVDLAPCVPNGIVNFEDIQQAVLAFQLLAYEAICPMPCDGSVATTAGADWNEMPTVEFSLTADLDEAGDLLVEVWAENAEAVHTYQVAAEAVDAYGNVYAPFDAFIDEDHDAYLLAGRQIITATNLDRGEIGAASLTDVSITAGRGYLATFIIDGEVASISPLIIRLQDSEGNLALDAAGNRLSIGGFDRSVKIGNGTSDRQATGGVKGRTLSRGR